MGLFRHSTAFAGSDLVLCFVDEAVVLRPVHHAAQFFTDFLDVVVVHARAHGLEARSASLVFQNPVAGEFTGLNVVQNSFHRLLGLFADDARTGNILTILRRVGDGVVHVGDAAFIDQVDDQLGFVQALEIGHLRRVAGFDQGFVTRLDQLNDAAAQNSLLAEQVGFGFLP